MKAIVVVIAEQETSGDDYADTCQLAGLLNLPCTPDKSLVVLNMFENEDVDQSELSLLADRVEAAVA